MAHQPDHLAAGGNAAHGAASFRRGFSERSPLVLLAAILCVALALAGFEALVRNGVFTVVSEGRFLRIAHDDYAHVTYRVAELRQDPPEGPVVYLFGGSGTMECFVSEGSLAGDVSREAGDAVGVVSLAAHGQSFAQTIAIVDNLPQGEALLVVGLASMRFTVSPEQDAGLLLGRTLPLVSPRLEAALAVQGVSAPPITSVLPGAFDYLSAYLRARPEDGVSLFEEVGYEPHYWDGEPAQSEAAKTSEAADRIALDRPLYESNGAYNLAMLEQLLVLARDRGFSVALFDQPLDLEVADPTWAGILPDYRHRVRALAERYGVSYLDVHQRVGLTSDDFGDIYHLIARGRLKWQPVLARQIAGALADEDLAGEPPALAEGSGVGPAAVVAGR